MSCFDSLGPVTLTTECRIVAPGFALKGSLSITSNDMYFDVDEEDAEFQKMDNEVSRGLGRICVKTVSANVTSRKLKGGKKKPIEWNSGKC